jgi:hypothetical protein
MMYVHYSQPMCGINLCHTTQHTTLISPSHILLPLRPSTMSLTPNKSSDKSSIDLIGPNEELPDFADIAWGIQNWASCQVRPESTETQLFCKFFGTSVRVVEILWPLVVWDKL